MQSFLLDCATTTDLFEEVPDKPRMFTRTVVRVRVEGYPKARTTLLLA